LVFFARRQQDGIGEIGDIVHGDYPTSFNLDFERVNFIFKRLHGVLTRK
jgi:hypothetical protein